MPYNPDLHHRRSIRLQNYDYSQNGAYFITTVVPQRECLLSTIVNGEVELTPVGKVIERTWNQLPGRFPFLHLDQFCIMPNHFHGILIFSCGKDPGQTLGQVLRVFKSLSGIAGNRAMGQKDRSSGRGIIKSM